MSKPCAQMHPSLHASCWLSCTFQQPLLILGAVVIALLPADLEDGGDRNSSILGIVLIGAMAGACLPFIIWWGIYKLKRRALIAAVAARLTAEDIAQKDNVPVDDIELSRYPHQDDALTLHLNPSAPPVTDATPAMQSVAKQMTQRCLRKWDCILAFKPSTDSLGNRQGIWRDKFLGVRASVMLLALNRLNTNLQASAMVPCDSDTGGTSAQAPCSHSICLNVLHTVMLNLMFTPCLICR